LYTNRVAIGGFQNAVYWSSSEYNFYYAWYFFFTNGNPTYGWAKVEYAYVRAVRAF
jgi:hypothetical protein